MNKRSTKQNAIKTVIHGDSILVEKYDNKQF